MNFESSILSGSGHRICHTQIKNTVKRRRGSPIYESFCLLKALEQVRLFSLVLAFVCERQSGNFDFSAFAGEAIVATAAFFLFTASCRFMALVMNSSNSNNSFG